MTPFAPPSTHDDRTGSFRERLPFRIPAYSFKKWAVIIVLLSTLIQIPGMFWGEVIDDHDLIHNFTERGCGENPAECFSHPVFGIYYRPLLGVSFSLGVRLHAWWSAPFPHLRSAYNMDAFGCHIENFALHACVVALALWLFRLLFRRDTPALLAGLVFGLHPLHVGVTTFIGGRTDTMALFFLFWYVIGLLKVEGLKDPPDNEDDMVPPHPGSASILPWRMAHRATHNTRLARHPGSASTLLWRIVSLLGFTGAIFTKEQSATLIVLAPLLVAFASQGTDSGTRGQRWFSWLWLTTYLAPIALYLWASQHVIPVSKLPKADWTTSLHIEMVGRTLWYFFRTLCLPMSAQLHQSTLGPWDTPQPLVMTLGYFMAGLWAAMVIRVWQDRALRFLGLWLGLTLLPCLNLVPIPSQFASPYRAVLPLFGLAGLVGMALSHADRGEAWLARIHRKSLPPGAMQFGLTSIITLFFLWQTVTDVPAWRNDVMLMEAEVAGDPNFLPALGGLANGRHYQHRDAEALDLYDAAILRLTPNAHTLKERLVAIQIPTTRRLLKSQSGLRYEPAFYGQLLARGRGGVLHTLGQYDSAIEDYLLALTLNPKDQEVRMALANCYTATGRKAEAWATENYILTLPPEE